MRNVADGGRFGPHQTFTVSGLPVSLAVGDFNGDQRPDVAVAGGPNGAAGNVSILYNTCAL